MNLPKINLPPIDPKYKIAGLICIFGLLIMGFYDHAYKPHAKSIELLKGELDGFRDRVTIIMNLEYPNVTSRTDILRLMEDKKINLLKTIESSERYLAGQTDTSKLLETLTALANAAGLSIKTLEPKPVQQNGTYFILPLVLDVSAEFGTIVLFLESIKNLPVVLDKLQISVRERPQLTARLVLTIYMK